MTEEEKLIKEVKKAKKKYEINLYQEILQLRKFEIENFWKRSLFFWGTIAIVLAGYFQLDLKQYLIFISFSGMIYNFIFSLSIRGSKYWQEHWETIAVVYEKTLNFRLLTHKADKLIALNNNSKYTSPYRFSVSKLTMLLSDVTVLVWGMFWLKDIYKSIKNKYVFFEFGCESNLHPFTIAVVAFHLILLLYIYNFFKYGGVYHKIEKA